MKSNIAIKQKVGEILADKDTKEWSITLGSESSRLNYPKHIAEYLVYRNLTIQQLRKNFKKSPIKEIKKVQEFVNFLLNRTEPKPLQPSSVGNYISAIKSRMKYDGIQLVREVKIQDRHYHQTIAEETTPDVEKVDNVIRNSKPSTQTITVLIALLGLRFKAMAGIKVGDFPEMKINNKKEIVFEKFPTRVKIRPELNKGKKRGYETFLIEKGCIILKNWLQIRMNSGEDITTESLIIPTECKNASTRRISNAIGRRLYTVFDKVKFGSRPYSLKGFFATQLMNSGIQQNYQAFLLGHVGPMQNEYTARRQLSQEQLELMRTLFKEKIEPYLIPQENNTDAKLKKTFKRLATGMQVETDETATTEETVDKLAEEINKAMHGVRESIAKEATTAGMNKIKNSYKNEANFVPKIQKIIQESELAKYISNGWIYQNTLPSGSLIIEQVNNQ